MQAMQDVDISAAYPEEVTNPDSRRERALQKMADYMANRTELTNRELLEYWNGQAGHWPHLSFLARLDAGVDGTSVKQRGTSPPPTARWTICALAWRLTSFNS